MLVFIDTLGIGGAEQMLVTLLPELKKLGVDCEVICLMDPALLAIPLGRQGIIVHQLHLSHRWNILEGFFKIKRILSGKSFEVFHGHLFFGAVYTWVAKLISPKTKTILSLHSLEFDRDFPDTFWHRLRLRIRKHILIEMDQLVAITHPVKEHYEKFLRVHNLPVIPNPVSIPEKKTIYQKNKIFTITVPARLIPEKGHLVLLEALSVLHQDGIHFECFLFGNGPEKDVILKEIEKRNLSSFIFLKGQLEHEALMQEMIKCDLVVLPSLSEGFGLAAAEAMALGKTVLASKTGGLAELIEDGKNGLLFSAGDAKDLARAIRSFQAGHYNIPLLEMAAKNHIQKNFSPDLIGQFWIKVYQENRK